MFESEIVLEKPSLDIHVSVVIVRATGITHPDDTRISHAVLLEVRGGGVGGWHDKAENRRQRLPQNQFIYPPPPPRISALTMLLMRTGTRSR